MKYLTGFIFCCILMIGACKFDNEVVDRLTNCSQEGIYAFDNVTLWTLFSATYTESSGTETIIDSTTCIDTSCAFVNLLFTDSTYTLDYFLPVMIDTNNYDTLQKSESGTYDFSYCFYLDSTQPIPEQWAGEVTFQPDSASIYSSDFYRIPGGLFVIEKIDLPDGSLEFSLRE